MHALPSGDPLMTVLDVATQCDSTNLGALDGGSSSESVKEPSTRRGFFPIMRLSYGFLWTESISNTKSPLVVTWEREREKRMRKGKHHKDIPYKIKCQWE